MSIEVPENLLPQTFEHHTSISTLELSSQEFPSFLSENDFDEVEKILGHDQGEENESKCKSRQKDLIDTSVSSSKSASSVLRKKWPTQKLVIPELSFDFDESDKENSMSNLSNLSVHKNAQKDLGSKFKIISPKKEEKSTKSNDSLNTFDSLLPDFGIKKLKDKLESLTKTNNHLSDLYFKKDEAFENLFSHKERVEEKYLNEKLLKESYLSKNLKLEKELRVAKQALKSKTFQFEILEQDRKLEKLERDLAGSDDEDNDHDLDDIIDVTVDHSHSHIQDDMEIRIPRDHLHKIKKSIQTQTEHLYFSQTGEALPFEIEDDNIEVIFEESEATLKKLNQLEIIEKSKYEKPPNGIPKLNLKKNRERLGSLNDPLTIREANCGNECGICQDDGKESVSELSEGKKKKKGLKRGDSISKKFKRIFRL